MNVECRCVCTYNIYRDIYIHTVTVMEKFNFLVLGTRPLSFRKSLVLSGQGLRDFVGVGEFQVRDQRTQYPSIKEDTLNR